MICGARCVEEACVEVLLCCLLFEGFVLVEGRVRSMECHTSEHLLPLPSCLGLHLSALLRLAVEWLAKRGLRDASVFAVRRCSVVFGSLSCSGLMWLKKRSSLYVE